jgi:sirohydrochlorin cobaltochelatase
MWAAAFPGSDPPLFVLRLASANCRGRFLLRKIQFKIQTKISKISKKRSIFMSIFMRVSKSVSRTHHVAQHVKKFAAGLLALGLSLAGAGCAPAAPAAAPVILVVSFGTSYNDNRELSIGAIEKALGAAYPAYEIRRAFTSQIIIDKLKERDGLAIDTVPQALERLAADGVAEVIVQPTHVMAGYEYDDVVAELAPYQGKFRRLAVGSPLLSSDSDYDALVSVLAEETKAHNTPGTAVVFMGHGTEHDANAVYGKLQQRVAEAGLANYIIGTVEAHPALEDVLALVKASGAAKVVLLPLMIVAGDHANNDMAGDEPDSWKSAFLAEGFDVACDLRGMGQYPGVQALVVRHAGEAME